MREGIRDAGGLAFEFPCHPIQETGKRPTASLDRNLAYLCLVEVLYGYPLDGVVLTIGCDKTTPACLMAAATVNIPAIAADRRAHAQRLAQKRPDRLGHGRVEGARDPGRRRDRLSAVHRPCRLLGAVHRPLQHHGHRLDDELACGGAGHAATRSAAIPAPYRERGQIAYATGRRIVDMVYEDLKPSDILTREAFLNAIVVNSAIGGSTNAPDPPQRHRPAHRRRADHRGLGDRRLDMPLLVNLQPAGDTSARTIHRAGGVPAVIAELMRHGMIHADALTCNGRTIGENCRGQRSAEDRDGDPRLRRPADGSEAGFLVLKGNLFDSAIMKTSVISEEFRARYLSDPDDPDGLRGAARGLRRPGGLPPAHRRPDLEIDEPRPVHAR